MFKIDIGLLSDNDLLQKVYFCIELADDFRKKNDLHAVHEYKMAISCMQVIAARRPLCLEELRLYADCYHQLGCVSSAIPEAEQAYTGAISLWLSAFQQLNEHDFLQLAASLFHRAELLRSQHNPLAMNDYKHLLQIINCCPLSSETLYYKAKAHFYLTQFEDAAASCLAISSIDSSDEIRRLYMAILTQAGLESKGAAIVRAQTIIDTFYQLTSCEPHDYESAAAAFHSLTELPASLVRNFNQFAANVLSGHASMQEFYLLLAAFGYWQDTDRKMLVLPQLVKLMTFIDNEVDNVNFPTSPLKLSLGTPKLRMEFQRHLTALHVCESVYQQVKAQQAFTSMQVQLEVNSEGQLALNIEFKNQNIENEQRIAQLETEVKNLSSQLQDAKRPTAQPQQSVYIKQNFMTNESVRNSSSEDLVKTYKPHHKRCTIS